MLLVLLLPACKKEAASLGNVTVELEQCTRINEGQDKLQLCFDAIVQDSRCPINANCVWQGVAVVRFTLLLNGQEHQLELATNNELPGTRTDTTIQSYTFLLRNVQPYPGSAGGEKPNAEVEVKKG